MYKFKVVYEANLGDDIFEDQELDVAPRADEEEASNVDFGEHIDWSKPISSSTIIFDDDSDMDRDRDTSNSKLLAAECVPGSFNPSGSEESDSDFDPEADEAGGGSLRNHEAGGSRQRSSKGSLEKNKRRGRPIKERKTDVDSSGEQGRSNISQSSNEPIRKRGRPKGNPPPLTEEEQRARSTLHERKRRGEIGEQFEDLRLAIAQNPTASRAQILKKTSELIEFMTRKIQDSQDNNQDIEDLRRQNKMLILQIRTLEKARSTGNYMDAHELGLGIKSEGSSHETDSSDGEGTTRRVKKLKLNGVSM